MSAPRDGFGPVQAGARIAAAALPALGAGGYVKIRPVDLRRFPAQAARLKAVEEFWSEQRPRGGLPSSADLALPSRRAIDPRLVYGRFLGAEPTSFLIDWFGAGLNSLHARQTSGRTLGELHAGPYLELIARDYHDIRKLAVPRIREVYAEVPRAGVQPLVLHYIGGVWPVSDDGKTVTGLVLVSATLN